MNHELETKELLGKLLEANAQQQFQAKRKDQRVIAWIGVIGAVAVFALGMMIKNSWSEGMQEATLSQHGRAIEAVRHKHVGLMGKVQDIRNVQTRILTLLENQKERTGEILQKLDTHYNTKPGRTGEHGL